MADCAGIIVVRKCVDPARLALADACDGHGRLGAVCEVTACRARGVIDARHWLAMGLGSLRLGYFEDRLRCLCGARRARLSAWPVELTASDVPSRLYAFH